MTYESKDRQWFALSSSGFLWPLGDCGDFDAAIETANDLELDVIWIVDADEARQWMNTLSVAMDRI